MDYLTWMNAHQARIDFHHEEMMVLMKASVANQEWTETQIKPDEEEMSAIDSEANLEGTEAIVEHEGILDEEATVEALTAVKD